MGAFNKLLAITFATLLAKPFSEWDAFKYGLIDEKGNKLREPENRPERDSLGPLKNFVRRIKRLLIKVVPDSRLLGILITTFLLRKESADLTEQEVEIKSIITENMTQFEIDAMITHLKILVKENAITKC